MTELVDSGIEWLGEIPAHWKICRLKYLANNINEKNNYTGGNYIGMENIESWTGKIIIANFENEIYVDSVLNSFDENFLLFGKLRPYLAKVAVPKFSGQCSTEFITLLPSEKIYKNFLFFVMISHGFICEVDSSTYGAKMPRASWNFIGNMKICFPPLEEQKKIAAFLDKKCSAIDSAVDNAKKLVEKFREYKKSLITETVTKGLNPSAKMIDSNIEWLGEIPAHWKIIKLKYLATIKNGQEYKNFFDENGKYPVIGSGGEFARATNFLYDKPSVLLGRKGTVDKPLFVNFPFWTVDTMYYTEIKNIVVPKFFFYLCLQIPYDYYQYGSALPSMTQRDLNSVKFPLPPLEEQKKIAAFLDEKCAAIDENISKHEKLAEKLTEYKKSLIYEVVTGKVEV